MTFFFVIIAIIGWLVALYWYQRASHAEECYKNAIRMYNQACDALGKEILKEISNK